MTRREGDALWMDGKDVTSAAAKEIAIRLVEDY